MKYELPKLPYEYDALEPFIDARTMEIHHTKHHAAYVEKLNAALEKHSEIADTPLEALLADLSKVPEDIRTAVRNHGGGHYNHSLFWKMMSPTGKGGGGEPGGELSKEIGKFFGDFTKFKEQFSYAALNIFGSGWVWLVVSKGGETKITITPNQDAPLNGDNPVLGIDMWEHAFYLLRQNRKSEYVDAFWNVVNWKQIEENYREAG